MYVWGSNQDEKLGLGVTAKAVSIPTKVSYWAEKSAFIIDKMKGGYRTEL